VPKKSTRKINVLAESVVAFAGAGRAKPAADGKFCRGRPRYLVAPKDALETRPAARPRG
jgi:hypothetical protein